MHLYKVAVIIAIGVVILGAGMLGGLAVLMWGSYG